MRIPWAESDLVRFLWLNDALEWASLSNVAGPFTVLVTFAGRVEIWKNQFSKWEWRWID